MGITYDYYKMGHPIEYKNFWSTTTTDAYKFVGGFGFNKPSSQSGLIYIRDWDDCQKEMETKVHMEKLFAINHILKNGDYTTVIWKDGTESIR